MNNNNPDAINDKYDDNVEMSAKAEEEGLIESACKTKKSKSISILIFLIKQREIPLKRPLMTQ